MDAAVTKERLMEVLSRVNSEKKELGRVCEENGARIGQLEQENEQLKRVIAQENRKQTDVFAREREKLEADFDIVLSQQTELVREQGEHLEEVLNDMKLALEREETRAAAAESALADVKADMLSLQMELAMVRSGGGEEGELAQTKQLLAERNEAIALVELEVNELKQAHADKISSLQLKLDSANGEAAEEEEWEAAKQREIEELKKQHCAEEYAKDFEIEDLKQQLKASLVEDGQVDELKQALADLQEATEAEIASLQQVLEDRAQEIKQLHSDQTDKVTEIAALGQKLAAGSGEDGENKLAELEQRSKAELAQLEQRFAELEQSSKAELAQLEQQLAKSEATNEQKLEEIESLKRQLEDMELAARRVDLLTEQLEASKAEADSLKEQLEVLNAEAESFKEQLEVSRAEAESFKEQLEVSKAEADSLKEQLEASRAEIESFKEQLEVSKAESLTEQLGALRAEAESLKEQLEASKAEADSLREHPDVSNAETDSLREQLQVLNAEVDSFKEQLEVSKAETESLKEQLEVSKAESLKEQQLADVQTSREREVGEWKQQLVDLEAETSDLKRQLAGAETLKQQLVDTEAEIGELKQQLARLEQTRAVGEEFLADFEALKLQQRLATVEHEQLVESLKQQLAEAEALNEQLADEAKALQRQLTDTVPAPNNQEVERQVAALQQQLSNLQQEPIPNDAVQRENAELRSQVAKLEALKQSFSQSLHGLEAQTEQFEKRLKEERLKLGEERTRNQVLQDDLSGANSRFESMLRGEAGPWVSHGEEDDMPAPTHLSLDSPVIQTILQAWTKDKDNLRFFNQWCKQILSAGEGLRTLQRGVELNKCTTQVKDGIMSMLVPLLRATPGLTISVFTRERVQVNYDVRLKVNTD